MKRIGILATLTGLCGYLAIAGAPAEQLTVGPASDAGQVTSSSQSARSKTKLVAAPAKLATLRAKFVYDGKAPERKKIDGSNDPFCGHLNILSEHMLIGDDGAIQNLALYMDPRKNKGIEIPEKLRKAEPKKIELDNKECVFVPHVLFARPGQTITVLNSDKTGHNANFNFFNNDARYRSISSLLDATIWHREAARKSDNGLSGSKACTRSKLSDASSIRFTRTYAEPRFL